MDHHGDVVDVQSARGDVGGDQRREGALPEAGQHVGAQALLLVAVQRGGGHPHLDQLLGDPLGAELGAGEQQRAPVAGGQLRGHRALGRRGDGQHVVVHGGHGGGDRGGLVLDGIHQEGVDDLLHLAVEGGGEQHLLGAHGGRGEDVAHIGQEAEVGQVIGLVDHGGLHQVQVQRPALGEVDEPARGGDHDGDAAGDGLGLLVDVHAARDQLRLQPDGSREGVDGVDHLHRELAGGHQHHAQRPAPMRLAAAEAGGHRQREGERLAGAGLRAGQHVPSGERIGEDRGLDLEGALEPLLGEDVEQLVGQRHLVEPLRAVGRAATGLGHRDPPDEADAPIIQHLAAVGYWWGCCAL